MKKQSITMGIVSLIALVLFSFSPKDATYKVNPSKSSIVWLGKKVTGEHTGKIGVKSGSIMMDGSKLTGGSFVVDMTSISCTDLEDEGYNKKLVGHLKSDDFFGVSKFPTAKYMIKSVKSKGGSSYEITGDLTIKGKTLPNTFMATVSEKGGMVTATGKMTVDRSKYDVKYGSSSFFEGLGDKVIYDEFTLDVSLAASK